MIRRIQYAVLAALASLAFVLAVTLTDDHKGMKPTDHLLDNNSRPNHDVGPQPTPEGTYVMYYPR